MQTNRFVHPGRNVLARALGALVNARGLAACRRAILSRLPFMQLESDVRDVVYLNWVVPIAAVQALVPPGVTLIERDGHTILTTLTYRHGHFGPALLGPLRRCLPSPLQSNWRLYVATYPGQIQAYRTVLFIRNLFSSTLHAVGSRLMSDVLPSHVAAGFQHEHTGTRYITAIASGAGSAPTLHSEAVVSPNEQLPAAFAPFFTSWIGAVTALCLQDSALCPVPGLTRLAHAGIDLPIAPDTVVPLDVIDCDPGDYLRGLGVSGTPFCFAVPAVKFRVLWERLL